jgi:hypothetical protein
MALARHYFGLAPTTQDALQQQLLFECSILDDLESEDQIRNLLEF